MSPFVGLSICLYVCLSVRVSREPHMHAAFGRGLRSGVVIRYVLSISCVFAHNRPGKGDARVGSTQSH